MELPKNITQIGETNPHCKVYVEDYVISYVKQMNQYARDKKLAVALYGVHKEEGGITYLFLYGACRLNFLERECRHLSQAVQQEVEKQRRKYFPDYTFLGYRLLDGEMVEGFYICEQDVCRYVEGYAQFYEKNDSMLSFMLDERKEEPKPEELNQEKYDAVKKRQEERRALAEERGRHIIGDKFRPFRNKAQGMPVQDKLRNMKLTAAAAFMLLCVVGLAVMGDDERMGGLQAAARRLMDDMTQQQLPDAVEVATGSAQTGVIVTEDKLTDALLKENAAAGIAAEEPSEGQDVDTEDSSPEIPLQPANATSEQPAGEGTQEPSEPSQESTGAMEESTEASASPPVSYTVKRGDTLIGICIRQYGNASRLSEICTLNNIGNPDDIKEGAKILLP